MRGWLVVLLMVVAVPSVAHAQITVTWDANTEPEVIGYRVYVGLAPGTYGHSFDVPGTIFDFTQGASGQRYYFAVVARAAVPCHCLMSPEISAVYPEQSAPVAPSPEGTYASDNVGRIVDRELAVWTVVGAEFRRNGIYANRVGDLLSFRAGVVSGRTAPDLWQSWLGDRWEVAGTTEPGLPTQPTDCLVAEWGEWGEWSAWTATELNTETRTRTRTRTIVTQPSGGGVACPPLTETETETRAKVDPCATDPLKITGIKWPTATTGNRSGSWNSGSRALATVQFQWSPTLRLVAIDTRGCLVTVVK